LADNASTASGAVHGIEGVRAIKDRVIGPSPWREVTQDMVDRFADLTGDHQWIHTDPVRAEAESPYRRTIAHGNLTLSLIDGLRIEMGSWAGFKMAVNYGWNKVRFPAPVLVGSRVRCTAQVVELTEVGGGWHQVVTRFTVESEGVEKPVCVADSVGRLLAEDAA
jgi:acyl dehydratase